MSDDAPYGQDDPKNDPDQGPIRARVRLPAIFLLIVSVLNLVAGIHFLVRAIDLKQGDSDAEDRTEKAWREMDPDARDWLNKQGWTAHDFLVIGANFFLGWGGLTALIAAFGLFGAIRMASLHSYRMAMLGAVLTAIPCVTPCCFIGQIAGIWAVIVLLNADVRKAFH